MDQNKTFPSPNGQFLLELHGVEMRMSHTVDCPYLLDTQTNKCLFYPGSLWDAYDVQWSGDSQKLSMAMRHYTNGQHSFSLTLNLGNDTAILSYESRELLTDSLEVIAKSMKEMDNVRHLLKT